MLDKTVAGAINQADQWLALNMFRWEVGPVFGSEDLCVLLYSLIRRERPQRVLELGTGLGVTAAWIAQALKENKKGILKTVDNGAYFADPRTQFFLSSLSSPLKSFLSWHDDQNYSDYLKSIFAKLHAEHHVDALNTDISFQIFEEGFDIVFSDFQHSPNMCIELIASALPRLSKNGSLFIDSASTHLASFLTLEHIVDCINRQTIPERLRSSMTEDAYHILHERLKNSKLLLTHLVECQERNQNSTAWLRWVPNGLSPSFGAFMH